jgi:hypothetical protein
MPDCELVELYKHDSHQPIFYVGIRSLPSLENVSSTLQSYFSSISLVGAVFWRHREEKGRRLTDRDGVDDQEARRHPRFLLASHSRRSLRRIRRSSVWVRADASPTPGIAIFAIMIYSIPTHTDMIQAQSAEFWPCPIGKISFPLDTETAPDI